MPTHERTWDPATVGDRLPAGWDFQENAIVRFYETDGWPTTLMAVNAIGYLCEAADHHPDLSVSWNRITVRLNTHTAGGVTDKDLELAREIDRLVLWRPAEGSALRGTTRKFVRGS
jgi:4a-hydroxytetrahydrobiopterin dehydratase